jgi:hypothetical protein
VNGKIVGVLLAGVAIIVGAYLVVSNAPVVLTVWIILCLGVGFTRDNRKMKRRYPIDEIARRDRLSKPLGKPEGWR